MAPAAASSAAGPVPARLSWGEFAPWFMAHWDQGEHVGLVGPTGQGKTTLALQVLERRGWVVAIATKPRDRTLAGLRRKGFVRIRSWPPPGNSHRVLLWPPWKDDRDNAKQAAVIHDAISAMFRAGGWCVFADDVQYLTRHLRLGEQLSTLWLQARSLNLSVVAATQRPRHVPLEMWSQSTHLFLWGTNDEDDLRRLSGFGGLSAKQIRAIVAALPKHHVLYINTRDGEMYVTKAERKA